MIKFLPGRDLLILRGKLLRSLENKGTDLERSRQTIEAIEKELAFRGEQIPEWHDAEKV